MTSAPRGLLLGRTVAALATALIPTTLTLALIDSGSSSDIGIVLACELLPMLLLLPVAGVVADRLPPQRLVLVADLVRAGAQVAIGCELLMGTVRVPVLALFSGVTGAAVAFGTPAVRTLVAAGVAGPDRLRINARLGVAQGVAQVAAPAVAGAFVLAAGAGWSSLLTGLLFLVSATTLGRLRPEYLPESTEPRPFAEEMREGWAETRRHRWFLVNLLGHGVWHLTAGLLLTLGPVLAVRHLGGEVAWVVITQLGTVGLLAGVFLTTRLRVRRPLVAVAWGGAVYALPLAAFALRLPMPVVAATYFAAMFGLGLLSPLWETAMQTRIPQEALGRVGSFDALISFAARPVGLAVAAPLATVTGTTGPLLVGAVLVAIANLAALLLPEVREDTGPAPDPDTPRPAGARRRLRVGRRLPASRTSSGES